MSVPPDQMMQGGPPPGPPMGPPGMGAGMAPNLLPFASTQPQGVMALAGPLIAQQQQDQDQLKQQQLEALMGVVMQAMQQMPNPAAQAAQTEPSAPMDGTAPVSPEDDQLAAGAPASTGAYGGTP